ncbi:hypothetical protein DCO58_09070 [Helicobacter saguini]|uniref:Uncharacterized protein n=1 Tax=Helicobacter saguini TaxID=1548018 RepID=A0A347W5A3_9HELI|nr:hypothetical protein [Helicobacter saguini]MWV61530.1 hypothetical protein [Helicobacter saguini]MWV67800.1 hypothetical protein [Helicobacter saguini]MWV70732.1 hypothetical protein [Helicobacter saguini]MWV72635.1 hypothetical protein [Helicobacter saguini]TLD94558.1 hypothetical protein LS64_005170 [Helicobacter saguini]
MIDFISGLFDSAKSWLEKIWVWCKKIFLSVVNFTKNIVDFFKNPQRLKQLENDKNVIAVSIKEKLGNGDFKVVNCLFNKNKGEIVGEETQSNENALGIETQSLDSETQKHFGDKDMIVLQ